MTSLLSITPYPHQDEMFDRVKDAFRSGYTKPVMVAPTGAGKSLVIAWIAASAAEKGKHAIIFTDRTILFDQLCEGFESHGIDHAVIKAALFGTDASMTSHTWSERDYVKGFEAGLHDRERDLLLSENPVNFLFGGGDVPQRYVRFLESRNPDALQALPAHVKMTAVNRFRIIGY